MSSPRTTRLAFNATAAVLAPVPVYTVPAARRTLIRGGVLSKAGIGAAQFNCYALSPGGRAYVIAHTFSNAPQVEYIDCRYVLNTGETLFVEVPTALTLIGWNIHGFEFEQL